MFNKSNKTAFSTVNVEELLIKEGAEVNHEAEAVSEPAPVIEKVSLNEIKAEQESEEDAAVVDAIKSYLELTPEQKAALKKALFG
ncbi:MAG: hypothetical protein E7341_01655 [Clostridiales bacterium]|nr:hypothetical protein [Clostridiales bacterium]